MSFPPERTRRGSIFPKLSVLVAVKLLWPNPPVFAVERPVLFLLLRRGENLSGAAVEEEARLLPLPLRPVRELCLLLRR